jgi:serine/threonine protein kinase
MRKLGKGAEGSASLYADFPTGDVVVVKTYTGIPRNPVPAELASDFPDYASQWQVEIEASLHMGQWKNGNETAFVPVRDYFVLESDDNEWEWALVTPFIEDGTLENLAKSTKIHERTPQKLDKIFRPVFDKILESLKLLHDTGFCHDDIKPDNIFIADAKHWLLGDLGNVRHFAHPWHDTRRWKRENQWSDCVYNDIRRMFKTYMTFLRESSGNQLDFDKEFFLEEQSWSKLYWVWMRQPVGVPATLELSDDYERNDEPEWKPDWSERLTARYKSCLERKVDVELTTMTLHLGPWDYWPLRAC